MIHKTLADSMRPIGLDDVIGQKHLVGENRLLKQFVKKDHPMSIILYGPPGCGKTTIAKALAHDLNIPYRIFNASTGNKKEMDQIITEAKLSEGLFVIVDEVHRLNKAKQDHLLYRKWLIDYCWLYNSQSLSFNQSCHSFKMSFMRSQAFK